MKEQNSFSDLELFDEIENESKKISPEDIDDIVLKEKQINRKANRLNLEKCGKLFRQLRLLMQMINDYRNHVYTEIPWKSIIIIIAAILYFLNPFDLIPDAIPLLGFTDDAAAVALVITHLRKDILNYCEWKGIPEEGLF